MIVNNNNLVIVIIVLLPDAPIRVLVPTCCNLLTSLYLANDPYEQRVSAAIITPSAYLIPITVVPVTIGC